MSDGTVNRAYLALGSNIDPEQNLPEAVRQLSRFGRVLAVSRVWETAPVGLTDQPNFLNAAALMETPLTACELRLQAIAEIERLLQRTRDSRNKNAARTIDIDMALFNCEILRIGHRKIPDPNILTRAFVAIPLAELDADYVHPENGRTLAQIAGDFKPQASEIQLRPDVVLLKI